MTPETWKKIGNIVEQALALEGVARQKFLDQSYKDEPDLKAEVEELLHAYETDKDFLEEPAIPGFTFDQDAIKLQQVGPYRIIRPLGQGGMGEVFLAQRGEGTVSKPVALKLIRASRDDTDIMLIRFQVEQQILSELTHPNIARLLDAGTSDDGRPYFVMEYVDGIPITDYCDQRKLSVDERLHLFLQACEAVQFAHQNLIVHRDLKPSNLLVTRKGEVKLLDFGIAKALSPWQTGVSALTTQTGFRVLTPPYASPEQVKGSAISTASDVYSLGILLYELLTGRRPYSLADKLEAEVVRVITEDEPSRPSHAITQHFEKKGEDGASKTFTPEHVGAFRQMTIDRLQKKLKGELDNIVLMALRKEAPRRYASAAGLAEDICRHLDGLPVEAQPDTLSYRAGKFIRRHRWAVAAAAAIALLLVVFSTVAFVQSARIQAQSATIAKERDAAQTAAESAENEAKKADEIVDILVGLFESANPINMPGGDTLRVGEFLVRGESKVLDNLDDRPEIQARMKHVIGEMYWAQGNWDKGVEMLKSGLAQQRDLKGESDLFAAEILRDLAMMELAEGRRDTALVMLRAAVSLFRQPGEKAKNERATTLLTLAPLLPLGEFEEKERMLEEANRLIEEMEAPDDMQRASAANQLGVFYYNQGAYSKALSPFEKTLAYLESAVGKSHQYYLTTAGNLAGMYKQLDRLEEARALHLQVLAERRKKNNKYFDYGIAWSLSALGTIALLEGDWKQAEDYQAEAHDIIVQNYGKDHQDMTAFALAYADALISRDKFEQAAGLIQQAIELEKRHYGERSVEYAWALYKQGNLQYRRWQWENALQTLDEVINIFGTFYADGQYTSIAAARLIKGQIYLKQSRPMRAYEEIKSALAYKMEHEAYNKPYLAKAQLWAGVALTRLGRNDEAAPLFEAGRFVLDRPAFFSEQDRLIVEGAILKSQE